MPSASLPRLAFSDEVAVVGSSLAIVGSFFWIPAAFIYAWRFHCKDSDGCVCWRRRAALLAALALLVFSPRSPRASARTWRVWNSWHRYFDSKVIFEDGVSTSLPSGKAHLVACMPHGVCE